MTRSWGQQLVACLTESLVFEGEPRAELSFLADHAGFRELAPESLLWEWGDQTDGVAVLLEGALDVQRTTEDGRTVVFRRLVPGDLLGFSTLAGEPHTADIVAATPSVVAILPGEHLRALLARRPKLALRIIGHLGHLIGLLTDEKIALRKPLEVRIWDWLQEHADEEGRAWIRHEDLAHHLDASRENVTRALRRFAKVKKIEQGRGWIRMRPPCEWEVEA